MILAVMVVVALVDAPRCAGADSQGYPSTMGVATNLPATVLGATGSNQVSVVALRANRGLALQWTFNATNAATATQSLYVYASVDGTNLASAPWATLSAAATGTTNVVLTTNWSRAALEGYAYLNLSMMTNAGLVSVTMTNKGVVWSFPNN